MSLRAVNLLAVLLAAGGGCVIVDVGVTNPIPGLSTVAVAPFFNQSQERAVDGREVALAYSAELQKVPGFQVVPVGVTELAIREHNLQLSGPDDALKLAAVLGVDAVVVGAITDFDPYYPPRIGLAVNWYSPSPWTFIPGLPIDPKLREDLRQGRLDPSGHDIDIVDPHWKPDGKDRARRRLWRQIKTPQIVRGQSQESGCLTASDHGAAVRAWQPTDVAARPAEKPGWTILLREAANNPAGGIDAETPAPAGSLRGPGLAGPGPLLLPEAPAVPVPLPNAAPCDPPVRVQSPAATLPPGLPVVLPFDPRQPLMSYTRLFDGADAELTAKLRDYLELRNDLRPGSWPAAIRRTDDFVRFTAHLMIVEMLTLHGGEGRRRVVLKFREH